MSMEMIRLVDVDGLKRMLREGPVRMLDVRSAPEFNSVHIPGAYNVPLDLVNEHAREMAAITEPVVLVCRSGSRAETARRALVNCGMPQALVLDGGLLAWERAGGAVVRGEQRWDLERQVRFVAGSLALIGFVLGFVVDPMLHAISAAIGLGLALAAMTNSCLMGTLLMKLPYNRAMPRCDVRQSVRDLVAETAPATAMNRHIRDNR